MYNEQGMRQVQLKGVLMMVGGRPRRGQIIITRGYKMVTGGSTARVQGFTHPSAGMHQHPSGGSGNIEMAKPQIKQNLVIFMHYLRLF
jgi:hypothetical protein